MQTNFTQALLAHRDGQIAEKIVHKCVHCGFCNATCPTFQITGDELDGPRGRIYLIKEMLENNTASESTATHLQQCLTCLSCETTCPSGVKFGNLLEIGKQHLVDVGPSNYLLKVKQWLICKLFTSPKRFRPIYLLGQLAGFAPASAEAAFNSPDLPNIKSTKKVILLDGCVQSVSKPEINQVLKKHLADLGIQTISVSQASCCGAIHHHNNMPEQGLEIMRKNIDGWWPHIEAGASALVMTATGCGLTVKDYGRLLEHDNEYTAKAKLISEITKDASEFLADYNFRRAIDKDLKVAFHPPCTLQHGQKISGVVEKILNDANYVTLDFKDKHLCCGSAGTYSLLQPQLASQLRSNKIKAITEVKPDIIATANIGCLLHLQQGTQTRVQHWLELIKVDRQ
jgi:glycolate oxidase iron-sulfur subunit